MSESIERRLARLAPRGAAPALEAEVLEAVGRALQTPSKTVCVARDRPWRKRWDVRCAMAAAAMLLLALGLNLHLADASDRRLVELRGASPSSPAEDSVSRPAMTLCDYAERNQQILRDVLAWEKGLCYETSSQGLEMERNRTDNPYHGSSSDQRLLGAPRRGAA